MTPIHEVLNRIRWDKEYGKAAFTLAYYDRVEDKLITVPFRELYFDREDHFAFQVIDEEGEIHNVPLHRVKEIHRNGECIWHRGY